VTRPGGPADQVPRTGWPRNLADVPVESGGPAAPGPGLGPARRSDECAVDEWSDYDGRRGAHPL
jgi:hypothetical protein